MVLSVSQIGRSVIACGGAVTLCVAASCGALAQGDDQNVDPVAQAKKKIEMICLKVVYPENFVRYVDLNRDGNDDLIIKYAVECDGYHSMFCGNEGCEGAVFIAKPDGGYARVNLPPDLEPTDWNGLPAVNVKRPPGTCGRERNCDVLRVWNGRRFLPLRYALAQGAKGFNGDDATLELGGRRLADLGPEVAARFDGLSGLASDPNTAGFDRVPPALDDDVVQDEEAAFTDIGPLPDDISAMLAAGAQRGRWFLSAGLRPGQLSAAVLGSDDRSALILSCAPGDFAFEFSLLPTEVAALRAPRIDGALTAIDSLIGGSVVDTLIARFFSGDGVWRDALPAGGKLVRGLRRGAKVTFQDPEFDLRIGEFTLDGSRRAIEAAMVGCAL